MNATEWHWLLLSGMPAVSLYSDPLACRNEATLQWILSGFTELLQHTCKESPMKGVWNNERSADTTYRPALDALRAVDASVLASALHAVVSDGAALMVSATRDQGAICLTLLSGNDRHRVYPSNVQELNSALQDLIDSLSTTTPPAPAAKAKR